ncbi:MAG TPA: S8 family serine peptidase [Verrucomicrobiae bacterium]
MFRSRVMTMIALRRLTVSILFAACVFAITQTARAENALQFHPVENRLDAQITNWSLDELLAQIAAVTGWEIYVEPDAQRTVNARFHDLPVGQALGRLLGDLNYALLPRERAPAKLFVFRTNAQEATRRIAPAASKKSSDKRIANELILTLKPGADADALARSLRAKITGRINGQNAYRLQLDDEAAAKAARDDLANNNLVAGIDDNYSIEHPIAAEPLAASSALPFSLKPTASTDSSRLIVGLIDTAMQRLDPAYDAFLLKALSVGSDFTPQSSTPEHGSSMAETILRGLAIASEDHGNSSPVRILPVDVYGPNENTSTFDVAWGISKAIENGATIINLSLGSSGDSKILQTVIQNARDQGVIFFAAAGNTPTTAPTYPAAYPEVTAVTAGDKRGNLAYYANYGGFVDVVGPGTSIVTFNGKAYMVVGTSSATAFMSGMAAGLANTTHRTPAQVESKIRTTFSFKPPAK